MRQTKKQMCMGVLLTAAAWVCGAWMTMSSVEAQTSRREPRVIEIDEMVIEGERQKPNAFYILNRSNLGYEVLDLRTSFLRQIIKTVGREPF